MKQIHSHLQRFIFLAVLFIAPQLLLAQVDRIADTKRNARPAERGAVNPTFTYFDPLVPTAAHSEGSPLDKVDVAQGGGTWNATKGIVLGVNGATAIAPGVAQIALPTATETIRVEADILATGSQWTGLAIGGPNLSTNFWQELGVLLYINDDGRYNVMAAKTNLIKTPDKTLVRNGRMNHLELSLNVSSRTISIRINDNTVLKDKELPDGTQLGKTLVAGIRFESPVMTGQPAVRNFKVELTGMSSSLEPVDIDMCFVQPDANSSLRWRLTTAKIRQQTSYLIRDYEGKQIDEGTVSIGEDRTISLTRKFARGYYEITFPETGQTFGIVSLEPHTGPRDPFFCMDSGLSWLELNHSHRESLVKILARCGIAMSRERLGLGAVNSEKGQFDWEGGKKFDSLRKVYAANNVPILEILDGKSKYLGSTVDLAGVATAWSQVANHWRVWAGAEASNEPDLESIPADQYASLVKSLSYALKAADSQASFVTGVFATIPPGSFFDTCVANRMLDESDAVSFHSYDRPQDIESVVVRYRTWLKDAGQERMPLWQTESGWSWKQGSDRPSRDQDAMSALEIAAKAVESMACGVARFFPFVFVYYEEGSKNFGMMGREATPLRSIAAYATCIQMLSGKQYLGDLVGLDRAVTIARVFGNPESGDECRCVLYTGRVDPQAELFFPFIVREVTGADGRRLRMHEQKLPISDGLAYVSMSLSDLQSKLKTDSVAKRLYQIGQNPVIPTRHASPLVLTFLAKNTPSKASTNRYLITSESARELPLNVRVHNLSQAAITFTPELHLPGVTLEKTASMTVPALGHHDVSWTLDVTHCLDIVQTRFISVSGKSEDGENPLSLAIPMLIEGTLSQHLAKHKRQLPLPITDLTNWKNNVAGNGQSNFSIVDENVWRMDVMFSGGQDNWSYPRFQLPWKIDAHVYSGFLIRAKILHASIRVAIIATSGGKSPTFWVNDLFPPDGEWHVVYVPFSEFNPGPGGGGVGNQNMRAVPANWSEVQLGMGGKAANNAFEVSHFILVGP